MKDFGFSSCFHNPCSLMLNKAEDAKGEQNRTEYLWVWVFPYFEGVFEPII